LVARIADTGGLGPGCWGHIRGRFAEGKKAKVTFGGWLVQLAR
jgi:hypothetical protein